jgi:Domain of unknown function (DUF1707)
MTGPDGKAAAARGPLRAAHADREQVIAVLKAAFAPGGLTKDEAPSTLLPRRPLKARQFQCHESAPVRSTALAQGTGLVLAINE